MWPASAERERACMRARRMHARTPAGRLSVCRVRAAFQRACSPTTATSARAGALEEPLALFAQSATLQPSAHAAAHAVADQSNFAILARSDDLAVAGEYPRRPRICAMHSLDGCGLLVLRFVLFSLPLINIGTEAESRGGGHGTTKCDSVSRGTVDRHWSSAEMSGRGLTKQGTQNFVKFGVPFMSFVLVGSYGLSEWVGAKIRMKDEKRQQVHHVALHTNTSTASADSLAAVDLAIQEKVLDELRDREKRANKKVLSSAPKVKKKFDAEAEYKKLMAKANHTADYENIPGKKVGER